MECPTLKFVSAGRVGRRISRVLAAMFLSVLALALVRPTVGFKFAPGTTGQVTFATSQGTSVRPIEEGRVAFPVPLFSREWSFAFSPGRYAISCLEVCGLSSVDSGMLAGLNHVGPEQMPGGGGLDLSVAEGATPLCHARLYLYMAVTLDALRMLLVVLPWLVLVRRRMFSYFKTLARFLSFLDTSRCFMTILAVVTVLVLFPRPIHPVEFGGVDPSWLWLLNRFAFQPVWGVEFVFTYGPLGFLVGPQTLSTALVALGVNLMTVGAFFCLLQSLHSVPDKAFHIGAWLLLLTVFFPVTNMEWRWVTISVVLLAVGSVTELPTKRRLMFAGMAGSLFPVMCYMKFSALIAIGATHAFIVCYLALRREWRVVLFYALPVLVLCPAFGMMLFDSPDAYGTWLKGSVEVAMGYNHQMHSPRSCPELVFTWISLTIPLVAVFCAEGAWRRRAAFLFVFSPLLFSLYKYNVIRQGPVPLQLAGGMLLGLSFCFFRGRTRCRCMFFGGLLLFSICSAVIYDPTFPRSIVHPGAVLDSLSLPSRAAEIAETAMWESEGVRLPEAWRERIGTNRVAFVSYLYDPAMSPREHFRLVPFAAVQPYSAYTPFLDEFCARRLSDPEAPAYLVAQLNPLGVDGRNLVLDNPRVWTTIRSFYDLVDTSGEYAFMKRRPSREDFPDAHRATVTFRLGIMGKVLTALYHPTRARLRMRYRGGHETVYTVSACNLEAPFFHRAIPDTPSEMRQFLVNKLDKDVESISIDSSDPLYVAEKGVVWE